jgi:germination protein YpeB
MPVVHPAVSQTSKFLSQVSDFSYALLRNNNKGQEISQDDYKTIETLKASSGNLGNGLHDLQKSIQEGNIDWGEVKSRGSRIFSQAQKTTADVKFQAISKDLQQVPSLTYDGPFSETMMSIKPKVLSEKEISVDEAKNAAINYIGKDKVEKIEVYSDKLAEKIPAYGFSVNLKGRKDSINIDISKNGGKIVYLIDNRDVASAKIEIKDAVAKGIKYLESSGYKSMIPTYTLRYDNVAIVNYVYVQNKVLIYPDQIKLKIALDNGEIVGVESQKYLISHTERKIEEPNISLDEARGKINSRIKIKNVRFAIIPADTTKEVLCYEFYGNYNNNERFIVYINAIDGTQERILKLIDTPNGQLSM